MKLDFSPFSIGTVFNPLRQKLGIVTPIYKSVGIKYPSRLNAMAIDPSKITSNRNLVYTPGEIVFAVKIYKKVRIDILKDRGVLEINSQAKRQPLIRHSYWLMKKALRFSEGMKITVDNSNEIRHAGLGSSSGLIASIAATINEIYGNPVNSLELIRYLAQNHGEEIDGDEDHLNPVQCIGGSAAAGLIMGGLLILSGESRVIARMRIPGNFKAIIGVPKDYVPLDSKILLEKEIRYFNRFLRTGKKYGPTIAYEILHRGLPAMVDGDFKPIGDIIFDYRFNMGSVRNCSYCYPKIVEIAEQLRFLKEKRIVDVLSLSSVGPAFFAISPNAETIVKAFKKENLKTFVVDIENDKYTVVSRKI